LRNIEAIYQHREGPSYSVPHESTTVMDIINAFESQKIKEKVIQKYDRSANLDICFWDSKMFKMILGLLTIAFVVSIAFLVSDWHKQEIQKVEIDYLTSTPLKFVISLKYLDLNKEVQVESKSLISKYESKIYALQTENQDLKFKISSLSSQAEVLSDALEVCKVDNSKLVSTIDANIKLIQQSMS